MDEAEKARLVEKYTSEETVVNRVDLAGYTRDAARPFAGGSPSVSVTAPREPPVDGNESLQTAIVSVVEYIDNCESDSSTISMTVDCEATSRLTIRTDGTGVPDVEREAFQAGKEAQLQHAGSVSLWLADRIVTSLGGSLSIDEGGRTITMTLSSPENCD